MRTETLPAWSVIAADAMRLRASVHEHLRHWGAMFHARRRASGYPSRWIAAMDSAAHPPRTSLAYAELGSTDRDRAEAAADDLWDSVAVAWAFVRWLQGERLELSPGVEHVVAELHAAGRWLAEYPVAVAGHDAAIARLFAAGERVAP